MTKKQIKLYTETFEDKCLSAQILAPGKAFGTLCFVNEETSHPVSANLAETEVNNEIKRFERMIHSVAKEFESAAERLNEDKYLNEAEILITHIYMLKDKQFIKKVIEKIRNYGVAADIAVERVSHEITKMFEQSDNVYISERAADFKDITEQLIRKLHRKDRKIFQTIIQTIEDPIIVIPELLPFGRCSLSR